MADTKMTYGIRFTAVAGAPFMWMGTENKNMDVYLVPES